MNLSTTILPLNSTTQSKQPIGSPVVRLSESTRPVTKADAPNFLSRSKLSKETELARAPKRR